MQQQCENFPRTGTLFFFPFPCTHISNGLLVIVGGVVVSNNNGQMTSGLAPMTQLPVFDTTSSTWSVKNATGQIPSTRTSHNAIVGEYMVSHRN